MGKGIGQCGRWGIGRTLGSSGCFRRFPQKGDTGYGRPMSYGGEATGVAGLFAAGSVSVADKGEWVWGQGSHPPAGHPPLLGSSSLVTANPPTLWKCCGNSGGNLVETGCGNVKIGERKPAFSTVGSPFFHKLWKSEIRFLTGKNLDFHISTSPYSSYIHSLSRSE